jgi:hypothetical protein
MHWLSSIINIGLVNQRPRIAEFFIFEFVPISCALNREKCRTVIAGLTEEKLNEKWIDESENMNLDLAASITMNYSVLEILFYNMRHVQHHVAQLNLLLRQAIDQAPDWVSQAKDELWAKWSHVRSKSEEVFIFA